MIRQGAFFISLLMFKAAMSFWLVKNCKLARDYIFDNWSWRLGRGALWDAYWLTLWRAALAGVIDSAIAFPAGLVLSFRMSASARRFALFCLIVPFFTAFLVRADGWKGILAESGPINAAL